MAFITFEKYSLYRWRYIIGYSTIGLLLIGLLIFSALFVPDGISSEEMRIAVRSNAIDFSDLSTLAITSLPYHLMQAGVFHLFGLTDFTMKIPSLIIGFFSAGGLILLLRRWFKPNIAVLASAIAVTTGQFLSIAQNAGPGVLYIFWPVAILLLGTQVTRGKRFRMLWKLLFTLAAALSLYTPLSIYPLIAALFATILHPHLRHAFNQLSKLRLLVCVVLAGVIIAPLVYLITINPELGPSLIGLPTQTLLGAQAQWPPDIFANISTLASQYFMFWAPSTTTLMTPVFGLGSILLIGLGLYRLIRTRDTTRSYLIIIWLFCLIPVLIINPRFTSVVFIPAVLLLAAGLTSLITYWYRLFPRNPYARITGLLPLLVLVLVLMGSGLDRFVFGYRYAPSTAINFSKDLQLLPKDTAQLVVSDNESAFYTAVANHRSGLDVTDSPTADQFVATRSAGTSFSGYQIDRIITTTYTNDADRLYVYKRVSQ